MAGKGSEKLKQQARLSGHDLGQGAVSRNEHFVDEKLARFIFSSQNLQIDCETGTTHQGGCVGTRFYS